MYPLQIKHLRISDELAIGLSYTIARWVLGVSFLNAAVWKLWVLSPMGHAEKFFITSFQHTWIPNLLLWTMGILIPFFELLVAALFCLGYKVREAAFFTGLLLIITTYGHSLLDPLYNISQGLTFARLTLVLFLLIVPKCHDVFSLDYFLIYRKRVTLQTY